MIDSVTRTGAVFAELPHKFEAGTINAAGAVGLKAAIDYIGGLGMANMQARELMLTRRALDGLKAIPHVHVLGSEKAEEHTGILTFTIDNVASPRRKRRAGCGSYLRAGGPSLRPAAAELSGA